MILLLSVLPLIAAAQDNAWESTPQEKAATTNPDAKYLEGAVPVDNGKVLFETVIKAPGKSANDLYDLMLKQMEFLTTEQNQVQPAQSRVVLSDAEKHQVVGSYQEWMVFKSTALVLDRTRFLYHLIADCKDGEVNLKLTRIIYIYEEERDPQTIPAEECIIDKYALNKKKTKLSRIYGKFRRKTVDRKDFIFEKFHQIVVK